MLTHEAGGVKRGVQWCPGGAKRGEHGPPGTLKNALDWLVASTEFPGMPVALVNASARSVYARQQLTETLQTMSAHLVSEAFVTVPLLGAVLTPEAIAANPQLAATLRKAIVDFVHAIELLPPRGGVT